MPFCLFALHMSAFDAVDGASSAASKWYRMIASKPERFKEVMPGNEMAFEVFKELARTRRRNADTVDPGIGRTRLGQRTLKCVFLIGTRSAHSIRASGLTAAQTGRTHDRTRPMLQQRQKVLAKAPSTHDPKRTWPLAVYSYLGQGVPPNLASFRTRYARRENCAQDLWGGSFSSLPCDLARQ